MLIIRALYMLVAELDEPLSTNILRKNNIIRSLIYVSILFYSFNTNANYNFIIQHTQCALKPSTLKSWI